MKIKLVIFILLFVVLFLTSEVFAFEKLTLRKSIDLALKNNPKIVALQHRITAAEGKVGQAVSGFFPTLSVNGEYGRNYQSPLTYTVGSFGAFSLLPDETAQATSYSLVLNQSLFTGGKLTTNFKTASLQHEKALSELQRAKQILAYRVTVFYFDVLKAQKLVALNEAALKSAEAHLRQTTLFVKAGRSNKIDLLQTEVQLATVKENKIKAENALRLARLRFSTILGKAVGEEIDVVEEEFQMEEQSLTGFEELIEKAYKARPDLISFEMDKKINELIVSRAYGEYFPNLALVGSIGRNLTEYPLAGEEYDLTSWSVVGSVSWKIFDGLGTAFKVKEAAANLEEIKTKEKEIKDQIAFEVKEASLLLANAKKCLATVEKRVKFAVENLRISTLMYKSGRATNVNVIDAQNAYNEAQSALFQAQFEYLLAQARIDLVLGEKFLSR